MTILYRMLSRNRALLAAGLSALVLMVLLQANANERGGTSVFGLQLAFTVENFRAVLDTWGAAGIGHFRGTLWLDYLFPAAYACLLAGIIARLNPAEETPPGRLPRTLFAACFLAALSDYTENTLHLVILADPASLSAPLILLASIAAALKWALITIAFLAIIYYLVKKALYAKRNHPSRKMPTKETL